MNISNLKRLYLVKKKIKNFKENEDEFQILIQLISKTKFSLKLRWGWSLSDLKNEIAFANFGFIVGDDEEFGSRGSIIRKINKIKEMMNGK